MAYQQPYGGAPPYGAPPQGQYGQPPYGAPPPGQYGAPPPQPYGAPAPQGQYGQPPAPYGAPQHQYGAPPAPYGHTPPPGQYGAPPPGQYGAPPQPYGSPAPAPYGAPPPGQYSAPAPYAAPVSYGPPTPASMGYGPVQQISWNPDPDADALRKAMKGFGTDEKTLIHVLATKDPLQINLVRQSFNYRHKRTLETDIKSETSGYFEDGLVALSRGPLLQDIHVLRNAMEGMGTKEDDLDDVLLGRSNADMAAIKASYQTTFHRSLEADLKSDLSMKTERHFMMVIAGNRAEDSAPVVPQQVDQDVMEIYKATEGKAGTDELLVCNILTSRNDAQIRAIAYTYEQKFRKNLETVISGEFSGHMRHALLHQLGTAKDPAMYHATLLEEAMAGAGTKDRLLVNRIIRYHWDKNHMGQVKGAYKQKYRRDLASRLRGELTGNYETLMIACIGG